MFASFNFFPFSLILRLTLHSENPATLTSEIDGLRVLTFGRCESISRVPDALVDVFSIGSTAAGSAFYLLSPPCSILCKCLYWPDTSYHWNITCRWDVPEISRQQCYETRLCSTIVEPPKPRLRFKRLAIIFLLQLMGAYELLATKCVKVTSPKNILNRLVVLIAVWIAEKQIALLRVSLFGISYMRSKKMTFNSWAMCKVEEFWSICVKRRIDDVFRIGLCHA